VTYRFKFVDAKQNRPDLTLDVQVDPNRLIGVDSQVYVHPFGNITQRGLSHAGSGFTCNLPLTSSTST